MDSDASDAPSVGSPLDGVPEGPRRTMWALAIDRVAGEVVGAMEDRGVDVILLKGPSIARWLYEPGERSYVDIDLLVNPAQVDRAAHELSVLGFTTNAAPQLPLDRPSYQEWTRKAVEPTIDLHPTLNLLEQIRPEKVWEVLSAHKEHFDLLGRDVIVLAPGARAFHLALHALSHGERMEQAKRDMDRALELLEFETWVEAAAIAERLSVVPLLAVALRSTVEGSAVADRLRLPESSLTSMEIRGVTKGGERWAALGVDWMWNLPLSKRAGLVFRKMFPSPAYLRPRSRVAQKGGVWFLVAYVARPFVILGWGLRGAATWMKARRRGQ